ncbi:4'-phosphopantetheinyl transferase family protein [Streptomyces shenzhenensis]|uniref:4'-phosphopantetheinyl transferase family protein n=1 Tax=Streptomyces shenzhenensis TaxID=943815 RepID=UPI001F3B29DB|nr:4'-phosphopantetheinyl transferase superfamily protein [Streptomyces shenzhenensis]
MIDEILPAAVMSAESFGDEPDAWLFPEERTALGEVGEPRRREYTTVRHCARRALGGLGLAPAPLVAGARGAPRWPEGVVGSMTHCAGYRAAATAHRSDVHTLGIDAEPHAPLPDGVLEYIALPQEASEVTRLARHTPAVHWDRLLFCAKEAVYKAWFPATQSWLGFEGAAISLAPDGTLHAHVLSPAPSQPVPAPREFAGRWLVRDGLVLACVVSPTLD